MKEAGLLSKSCNPVAYVSRPLSFMWKCLWNQAQMETGLESEIAGDNFIKHFLSLPTGQNKIECLYPIFLNSKLIQQLKHVRP
jgi:hypothetical protein